MRNKKTFTAPRVLQTLDVILEEDFLQGPSIVDDSMRVRAMGQELETMDFTDTNTGNYNDVWD